MLILYIDQTAVVFNNPIETDQRSSSANLPDVAQDGYIEVIVPPRMQIGTLVNLTINILDFYVIYNHYYSIWL